MRPQFHAQVRSPATLLATLAALFIVAASPQCARAEEPVDRSTPLRLSSQPGSLRLDGQGWVARLDLATDFDRRSARSLRPGWQLMGDYYFGATPGSANGNGLRATGGWVGLAASSAALSASGPSTYLGLGYSLGLDRPGWGLKADVGLLSSRDGSGGLRLSRSGTSMDDASAIGDLRWLPKLQVGVSYAF